ncbi:MFS transporter [Providencia burhodogranariea]|uniref:Putative mutlidrug resistance protein n=1 Tax=Providencia burhodogranariea DSM 19968 TaxID=1141662 RepID=K8WXY5_9GAMM|nr:MFS transporter [Providencia burhodogranariea]EKT64781.1 putative mutlidrug resistance protein [Providencia burhodogranariea DSM 19968]
MKPLSCYLFTKFKFNQSQSIIYYTFVFIFVLAASSAPTPLYNLYQSQIGFSTIMLTLIFAVYSFSLLLTLLIAGALSDYIGRKPVIFIAILLLSLSMILFLFANTVSELLVARALQGLATGLATSSICASIIDINKVLGAKINSFSPMIGMAAGMMISCSVISLTLAPIRDVFIVLIAILALILGLFVFTTETGERKYGAISSLKPTVSIPVAAREKFLTISPINIALWMLSGFYLSLMPSLLSSVFINPSVWVSGSAFLLLTISASVAIVILKKVSYINAMLFGITFISSGMLLILSGANTSSANSLFLGSLLAGIGFGLSFMGVMSCLFSNINHAEKGQLISIFYIESYLAFSMPVLIMSLLMNQFGINLMQATNAYGAILMTLLLISFYFIFKHKMRYSKRKSNLSPNT